MEDEGEEEEDGPVYGDDSQSEGSVLTGMDGAEGGASDAGGESAAGGSKTEGLADSGGVAAGSKLQKSRKADTNAGAQNQDHAATPSIQPQTSFTAMADTEAMMNGLKVEDGDEALEFAETGQVSSGAPAAPTNGHGVSAGERQRRDHEQYRQRRDADPSFIPNRGNFFMHDTRGQPNGNGPSQRGAYQGRGRGRAPITYVGYDAPSHRAGTDDRAPEQQTWKHDLHNSVVEETRPQPSNGSRPQYAPQEQTDAERLFLRPPPPTQAHHNAISFSSTTLVGKVQIRVVLPGMKARATFSAVPWKQYIRLPDHRPPLRRDKPVRIALPNHTPRYIFPSTERSFIFIPRQMRPNQQRFGHNAYQRSVGGHGYSSRRTSMYGGSMYSASVAASRRSSLAGMSRDRAFSPAGSSFAGMPPSNRPVVRLPNSAHASAYHTPVGMHTPTGMPPMQNFPPPQPPVFQGTPTSTMHQPRPQKAISVTGIESPALLAQASGEHQPFQNQLPAHMSKPPPPPYLSPRQQYPYTHSQPTQAGTPLSGIPEQAIHAPAFQQASPAYGQQGYYQPYPPQQNYYYPPPGPPQNGYPQMPPPMYMMPPPPQQQGYMGSPMHHHQPPAPAQSIPPPPPPLDNHEQQPQQSGMVAHESNGMVFYVPASEAQNQSGAENYQPAEGFVPSYAMPGLPPPTPAPENSMAYYYPPPPAPQQQLGGGMQEMGAAVYYPAQPQQ